MDFEFNNQFVPQNRIEIDQIGDFVLQGSNEEGYFYYLFAKTFYGTTVMISLGPILPDAFAIPTGFHVSLDKVPYKEEKIAKSINFFLNDRSKKLTDAKTIELSEMMSQIPDIKDYILNLNEDTF